MNTWKFGATLLPCLCLLLLQTACKSSAGEENTGGSDSAVIDESQRILEKEAFAAAIKKSGAVVIDVRQPPEFEQSHIEKAINIDFFNPEFKYQLLELDRKKKYYLYCKNENRSYRSMKFMEDNDFKQVYMLKGGYQEWNTAKAEEALK